MAYVILAAAYMCSAAVLCPLWSTLTPCMLKCERAFSSCFFAPGWPHMHAICNVGGSQVLPAVTVLVKFGDFSLYVLGLHLDFNLRLFSNRSDYFLFCFQSCDLWSLGVIIYVMLCGYPPFYSKHHSRTIPKDMRKKIMTGSFEFPEEEWSQISEMAKDVVRK